MNLQELSSPKIKYFNIFFLEKDVNFCIEGSMQMLLGLVEFH